MVVLFQSPTEKKRPGTAYTEQLTLCAKQVSVSYGEETSRDGIAGTMACLTSCVSVSYGEETSRDFTAGISRLHPRPVSVSYGEETSRDSAKACSRAP